MPIVGGLDIHRRQITFDYLDTDAAGYPDDPLQTFPAGDPYVRRAEFGEAGLVTYGQFGRRQSLSFVNVGLPAELLLL
jgi:hypothetical protein